ncbi:hypothetical protein NDU88_001285 [Pleurodeles waltl]|uniref:Uncharacterized protein n=1 Tax=Pleurodeles waltl TaxID=8319 RepID=A0AAV7WM78_PLEWA|nr:hypothetical protein NDU88_001285 [Pleurodeles waltl]
MQKRLEDQTHQSASQVQSPRADRGCPKHTPDGINLTNLPRLRAKRRRQHCLEVYGAVKAYQKQTQTIDVNWLTVASRLLAHRLRTQATGRRVAELRLPDGTLTCQEGLIHHQFERFYS